MHHLFDRANGLKRISTLSLLALPLAFGASQVAAQTNAPPVPKWDTSVALGVTLTRGNSDSALLTISGRADKACKKQELHLGADFAYGEADSVKNNESLRGFGQYNYLFSERWFAYIRGEALHDAVADVEYRVTLGPGAGYYVIKNAKTSLSVEAGSAVVFEKQGDDSQTYLTARAGEKFEHKFNDRVRIWESAEILPQVDELNNFIVNAEAGVESALSKSWALRVVVQDTYDNEPAPGREKNDLKLIAAIAWKNH
jgi:putative salt-induced outer membrane protein YdiY